MSVRLINFLFILLNVAMAVSGQFAIKYGMKQVGVIQYQNFFPLIKVAFLNIFVLIGLFAYTLAAVIWILVLSRVDLSLAYPMLSIGYIVILVLSYFYLGESLHVLRVVGTAFVVVGIILIYRS